MGLLREPGTGTDVPVPGIADLPALLDGDRAGGLDVVATVAVLPGVDPTVGLVVYRVVQESLTNVLRHAPGAACTVDVAPAGDAVEVVVVNRPGVPVPATWHATRGPASACAAWSSGCALGWRSGGRPDPRWWGRVAATIRPALGVGGRCDGVRDRRAIERGGVVVASGRPLRVVLVDDQPLVRAGIAFILSTEPGIEVASEAANGELGIAAVAGHRPDVVLMDVRMPVMDGIEATRRIATDGGPPVLVLTTFDDDEVLWGAVEAGAAGFLLKDTAADDLIRAIRTIADGGSWLDPRVTPRLLAALREGRPHDVARAAPLEQLSEREAEVLALVARGASNVEIADRLYVSERTVKGHVGNIFAKLGARDRAAAIVLAYDAGLVVPGG